MQQEWLESSTRNENRLRGNNDVHHKDRRNRDKDALENESVEVLLDDHVLHRFHGGFQQRRVRRVGVVDVDFAVWDSVDAAETVCKESCTSVKVRIGACVIGEVLGDG